MRILIATGVYPPQAGGPSYYAKSLKDEFEKLGHTVFVKTYTFERSLPTGIRHFWFFLKTLPAFIRADLVLVFDTFSVGFPVALMQKLLRRNTILRIGGDFLWEQYVERTKEKILFSHFYDTERSFTFKERLIHGATKVALTTLTHIIFTTNYQKNIWTSAYDISPQKISIIENRFEPVKESCPVTGKTFVYVAARPLVWKNADVAKEAFALAQKTVPDIRLEFLFDVPREEAIEKIKNAYAVILTSLGDISPNYILRALTFGKPVILTKENGLRERVGDAALYVDPLSPVEISRAIIEMTRPEVYEKQVERVRALSFTHTYSDIAKEFLALCKAS